MNLDNPKKNCGDPRKLLLILLGIYLTFYCWKYILCTTLIGVSWQVLEQIISIVSQYSKPLEFSSDRHIILLFSIHIHNQSTFLTWCIWITFNLRLHIVIVLPLDHYSLLIRLFSICCSTWERPNQKITNWTMHCLTFIFYFWLIYSWFLHLDLLFLINIVWFLLKLLIFLY